MNKIKILTLTLLVSLFSCTKDDDTEPQNQNQNCKISKITYGYLSNDNVYNVVYENNKIKEFVSNTEKVIFTYNSSGNLSKREFFDIGNPQVLFRTEYTSNTNGQIIETKSWEYYNNVLEYTGKETYTYSNSKLVEINDYDNDDVTIDTKLEFIWTNDNPTTLNVRDGNGTLECSNTLVYDLNKVNTFNSTFENFMFYDIYVENLYQFLGKNTLISTTNGCSNDTDNYFYTLLSNGLTDNVTLNGSQLWKFEYTCE